MTEGRNGFPVAQELHESPVNLTCQGVLDLIVTKRKGLAYQRGPCNDLWSRRYFDSDVADSCFSCTFGSSLLFDALSLFILEQHPFSSVQHSCFVFVPCFEALVSFASAIAAPASIADNTTNVTIRFTRPS